MSHDLFFDNYMLHHKYILRVFIINFLIKYSHFQTENQSCKTKL